MNTRSFLVNVTITNSDRTMVSFVSRVKREIVLPDGFVFKKYLFEKKNYVITTAGTSVSSLEDFAETGMVEERRLSVRPNDLYNIISDRPENSFRSVVEIIRILREFALYAFVYIGCDLRFDEEEKKEFTKKIFTMKNVNRINVKDRNGLILYVLLQKEIPDIDLRYELEKIM